jgi:hypothetical protein
LFLASLSSLLQTRPEKPAKDKHSSVLQTLVNYGRKKFYNIRPRPEMRRPETEAESGFLDNREIVTLAQKSPDTGVTDFSQDQGLML